MSIGPPDENVMQRIRLALESESAKTSKPSWKKDVVKLVVASVGFTAAVAVLGVLTDSFELSHIAGRLGPMSLIAVACSGLAYVALAPQNRALRIPALALAVMAAGVLVVTRPASVPQSFPEWWCTMGHLGFGVIPLFIALTVLRRFAFSWWRAGLAGASAGCIGALLGELGCVEGPGHVLWYHLPAWGLVAVATLILARQKKPDSFAP
jgi:hypothetical protein